MSIRLFEAKYWPLEKFVAYPTIKIWYFSTSSSSYDDCYDEK